MKYKKYNTTDISYMYWRNMIHRCKNHLKYSDCSIVDEWLNFENFAEWFHKNIVDINFNYNLDKDLLIYGNKIYGPDTCCLIPVQINTFVTSVKSRALPIGVHKKHQKFKAQIKLSGLTTHIGTFDTINEASEAFRIAKNNEAKRLAIEFKHIITEKVFNKLMNYNFYDTFFAL